MILVENDQNKISIDLKKLEADAQKILMLLDYNDFDLGIMLTTNEHIKQMNRQFRGKDKPTDILSFPFYPHLKVGERIQADDQEETNLGDIIISPEYVQADLERWGESFEQRMQTLLVHGICHLLGYDHIEDADYEIMKKQEQFLLEKLRQSV